MARDFESGSSERLTRSAPITTASTNISLGCFVTPESLSATMAAIYNGFGGGGGGGYGLRVLTSGKVDLDISFVASIQSTSAMLAGEKHHIGVTRDATTWRVYYDGVQENTGTNNALNMGAGLTSIGARRTDGGSWDNHFDGVEEECFFYAREVSAAEMLAFSKGVSPLYYPRSLLMYKPIVGSSPEVEWVDKGTWTITGTTKAAHRRVFNPIDKQGPGIDPTSAPPPYVDIEPGQYSNRSPQELINIIAGNTPATGPSMQEVLATALGVQPRTGSSVQELFAKAYGIVPGTSKAPENMVYDRLVALGVTFPSPWSSYSMQQLLDKALAQGFTLNQLLALS